MKRKYPVVDLKRKHLFLKMTIKYLSEKVNCRRIDKILA